MTRIPPRISSGAIHRDGECVIASERCTGGPLVADHRTGRGAGGNPAFNVSYNLVAACRTCNGLKESDSEVAADCRRRGLKLRRSQSTTKDLDAALVTPIRYPDGNWYRLHDGPGFGRSYVPTHEAVEFMAAAGYITQEAP